MAIGDYLTKNVIFVIIVMAVFIGGFVWVKEGYDDCYKCASSPAAQYDYRRLAPCDAVHQVQVCTDPNNSQSIIANCDATYKKRVTC
jgi:hypothetical protein